MSSVPKTILVTGSAGFIGFHVAKELLQQGHYVIGVDNLNDYYDVTLKQSRLNILQQQPNFTFYKLDVSDREGILALKQYSIEYIVHLAAQAGVRYSLINPYAYTKSNVEGQLVILELARNLPNLRHLVYASSSSVYGANQKLPFAISDRVDNPISLYAATKKSCELMSHCYSHLYGIKATGLRYFTVYGPWGRPDMALFIFAKAISQQEKLPVYNNGNMRRNFTYIDDISAGTIACLFAQNLPHDVYNLGNNRSEKLLDFIAELEKQFGTKANLEMLPMQAGDVKETIADIDSSSRDFGFSPKVNIDVGIKQFVAWYQKHIAVHA